MKIIRYFNFPLILETICDAVIMSMLLWMAISYLDVVWCTLTPGASISHHSWNFFYLLLVCFLS